MVLIQPLVSPVTLCLRVQDLDGRARIAQYSESCWWQLVCAGQDKDILPSRKKADVAVVEDDVKKHYTVIE